jgi:hypothetical protein
LKVAESTYGALVIKGQKEDAAREAAAKLEAKAKADAAEKLSQAREAAQLKLNALNASKADDAAKARVTAQNVATLAAVEEAGKKIVAAAIQEGSVKV